MRDMVFTLSTDVYTLIQCHLNAFEYFSGYTEEILYGNEDIPKQLCGRHGLMDVLGSPHALNLHLMGYFVLKSD